MSINLNSQEEKSVKIEVSFKGSFTFDFTEQDMKTKDSQEFLDKIKKLIIKEITNEQNLGRLIKIKSATENNSENSKIDEKKFSSSSINFKRLSSANNFHDIPEIFNSLLESNRNSQKNEENNLLKEGKESNENLIRKKTASGKDLGLEPTQQKQESKFAKVDESDKFFEDSDDSLIHIREEGKCSSEFVTDYGNLGYPTREVSKLNESFDSQESPEGHFMHLLICDNFKQSYETTLAAAAMPDDSMACDHMSKNYKVSVLFGNISYSIGLYDKALYFYEKALNFLQSEKPHEDVEESEVNHLLHLALLQSNIARSYINCLKITEGIAYLISASENLSSIHRESLENKGLLNQILLLKINIEFNLVESYHMIENYERSKFFLDNISNVINNQLKSFKDHKEKQKILARYYNNLGKLQLKSNDTISSLNNFERASNLIPENDTQSQAMLPDIYNNISLVHSKLLDNEKALLFANKSLEVKTRLYGEDDIKTLLSYINIAYFYQASKKIKLALETLQHALEICEKNKDIEEIFTAVLYRALGQCYFALGNELKGLCNYSKANVIYKKFLLNKFISLSEVNMVIQNMFGIISI
jgi:tetratricopeptide (TPR) repeat protein